MTITERVKQNLESTGLFNVEGGEQWVKLQQAVTELSEVLEKHVNNGASERTIMGYFKASLEGFKISQSGEVSKEIKPSEK